MADRRTEIREALAAATEDTVGFYNALTPDQLQQIVYTDDVHWTVRQVLAHLVTIEKSMQALFQDILSGGPGSPANFDVMRFNRSQPQKLDHLAMPELIGRFKAVRRETIAMLTTMAEADLDRKGRHVFLGRDKLERFIRWTYEHAHLHIEDVRRALALTD